MSGGASVLDALIDRLAALPKEERKQLEAEAEKFTAHMLWIPNPGPQTDAYYSQADVLLYGGQGGGGKSDLGLGLAFMEHKRSLVMRRKYANLSALTERAIKINGSRNGFNGSPPPLLRATSNGAERYIQFGANQFAGDEEDWQGQAFDFKYFDEAVQFLESQVRFHLGWLRPMDGDTTQRCRAVLGSNPPVSAEGDWIIGMFRPWLDITHPKPAKHGELRWYLTAPDGTDLEVPEEDLGRDEFGRRCHRELVSPDGRPLLAMSRSFIPASLDDNPYYAKSDYRAKLDGLPEPLRSAVRDGNFMALRKDADFQVIPTQWVVEAQARWTPDGGRGKAMSAMAFDPAGGGRDSAELAVRYGGWYDELVSASGEETADGSRSAATIIMNRRDAAPIVVDVGGGYGGQVTMRLGDNKIDHLPFNGAGVSSGTSADGQLSFVNMRAEAWWRLRDALNPDQDGGSPIDLPPDPELRADLTVPTYKITGRGVQVESKDDIRKRLGRSPGKGDAVVMCWSEGDRAIIRKLARVERARSGIQTQTQGGRSRSAIFHRFGPNKFTPAAKVGPGSNGGEQG